MEARIGLTPHTCFDKIPTFLLLENSMFTICFSQHSNILRIKIWRTQSCSIEKNAAEESVQFVNEPLHHLAYRIINKSCSSLQGSSRVGRGVWKFLTKHPPDLSYHNIINPCTSHTTLCTVVHYIKYSMGRTIWSHFLLVKYSGIQLFPSCRTFRQSIGNSAVKSWTSSTSRF